MVDPAHGSAHDAAHGHPATGHGHSDPDPEIRPRLFLWLGLILVVVTVGYAALVRPMTMAFLHMDERAEAGLPVPDPVRPPGPLLQPKPEDELKVFREREETILHTWGWVDQAQGIARVPLAEARARVLAEGLGGPAPFGDPELAEGEEPGTLAPTESNFQLAPGAAASAPQSEGVHP